MLSTRTLRNSLRLIKSDLSQSYRGDSRKFYIVIGISTFLVLLWTTVVAGFYFLHLQNPFSTNTSEALDLFHQLNFLIFAFLLYYSIIYLIAGIFHPYISSLEIMTLIARVPIKRDVLYYSTLAKSAIKAAMFAFFHILMFSPVLIMGGFPWYHFLFAYLTSFLAIMQIIAICYVIYFLTTSLRRKINSIDFLYDTGNAASGFLQLLPLVVGFLSITEDFAPTFAQYSTLFFIPPINSSLAFSGFFLRSGIPSASILSFGVQLAVIVVLFAVVEALSRNYSFLPELEITSGKFMTNKMMQQQGIFSQSSKTFQLREEIDFGSFPQGDTLKSLILKDWLAIRRTKKGDQAIYSLGMIIPFTWLMISQVELGRFLIVFLIVIIYLVTNLVLIILSIDDSQLISRCSHVTRNTIRQSKFVLLLPIILLSFSPFWLINFWFLPIASIVISLILSYFAGSSTFQTIQGQMIINGLLFLIVAPVMTALGPQQP